MDFQSNMVEQRQTTGVSIVSDQNKKRGLICLLLSFFMLPLVLILWAITAFILSRMVLATGASGMGAARLLNIFYGLLGLGGFIAFPLSFYFFTRKEIDTVNAYDERSGKGEQSIIPKEIDHWNWAAAFLTLFWGLSHRVWLALLVFVPIVNLFLWILMGKYGNKWAWQHAPWKSVEDFHAAQRRWRPWGIAAFGLGLLFFSFWIWL